MKQDLTLLIMAAGMGSRFGGLKQIEPVGPYGEFLIDYSIYDAICAGFTKVVFVIKKENEVVFRETIGNRVEKHIKVEYAFQDIQDIPFGYSVLEGREKPWGTAQAVLCAKEFIHEPFVIINADDFYGRESYAIAAHFLRQNTDSSTYCMVGYKVQNTLSDYGSVKRAIIQQRNGELVDLVECNIKKNRDVIMASPLNGDASFPVQLDSLVSMNMFGLKPSVFSYLEKGFSCFLSEDKNQTLTSEYLIPDALNEAVSSKQAVIKILSTDSTWYGVTYKEDKKEVVENIDKMIKEGIYLEYLWRKET